MICVISVALMCLSVLPHTIGSENSCQNFRLNSQHLDQYLIGHELGVRVGLHHHACVRECMTYKACMSTDYIKSNATCKLNNVKSSSVHPSEFLYLPGAIYSDIEMWPSTMVGKCGSRPCRHNQKCHFTNDNYRCEDIDCGNPPVIQNGRINLSSPEKTKYSDEAIVTCDVGYLFSKSNVTCLSNSTWENVFCKVPTACKDFKDLDHTSPSGVYNITLWQSRKVIQVYCDMDTDDGGWTVIQRRFNNATNFYRGITDYRNGFGSIEGEFWLGLTNIREITHQHATYLRLNMTRASGTTGFELISNFRLEGDNFNFSSGYTLATEGFVKSRNNMTYNLHYGFSTYDHDVDDKIDKNCAVLRHGAWWYRSCTWINLNGRYCIPGTDNGKIEFNHYGFDLFNGLKNSAMMLKRMM